MRTLEDFVVIDLRNSYSPYLSANFRRVTTCRICLSLNLARGTCALLTRYRFLVYFLFSLLYIQDISSDLNLKGAVMSAKNSGFGFRFERHSLEFYKTKHSLSSGSSERS